MNLSDCISYSYLLIPDKLRYPMSHGDYVEALDGDRIMVSWFAGSREWARDVHLLSSVFDTGGRSWLPITTLVSEIDYTVGNSVVALDPDGQVHLWYVRTKRYWQDGEIMHMLSPNALPEFKNKEQVSLPPSWLIRGRPIFKGGSIYLPVYHEMDNISAVWETGPAGTTGQLHEAITAEGGLIHPVLIDTGGREFRALFRNPAHPKLIHHAYSMDRGQSWSKAIATNLPNPNSGIDAISLGENVFLCVYNDSTHNRYPLSLAISRNRGINWVKIGDLERVPTEFSYPSLFKTEGAVHLVYTYKRNSIKFISIDTDRILKLIEE